MIDQSNKRLPKYVYHYTKTSTLFYLLDTRHQIICKNEAKDQYSCKPSDSWFEFHATDIDFLNDRTEYREAKNFLKQVKESHADALFLKALDGIPFVLSFSTKRDYLPMWRMYADVGHGICLKFNTQKLVAAIENTKLNPCQGSKYGLCEYTMPSLFKERIRELKGLYKEPKRWEGSMKLMGSLSELNKSAALLKDSAFEPEQEWRAVFFDTDYCFKARSNVFVAYKPIKIPVSCLEEIRLGPCSSTNAYNTIIKWVEPINQSTCKFEIKVSKSKIPYQS